MSDGIISDEDRKSALSQDEDKPAGFCIFKSLTAAITGGGMGALFGAFSGVTKKERSFGLVMSEGKASAKTFALMSATNSLVTCYLSQLRGKHDEYNAGIAGCATGIVLGWGGNPQALAQGCATFGVLSYMLEKFQAAPAMAHTASRADSETARMPLMSLALPPFVTSITDHPVVSNTRKQLSRGKRQVQQLLKRHCPGGCQVGPSIF